MLIEMEPKAKEKFEPSLIITSFYKDYHLFVKNLIFLKVFKEQKSFDITKTTCDFQRKCQQQYNKLPNIIQLPNIDNSKLSFFH